MTFPTACPAEAQTKTMRCRHLRYFSEPDPFPGVPVPAAKPESSQQQIDFWVVYDIRPTGAKRSAVFGGSTSRAAAQPATTTPGAGEPCVRELPLGDQSTQPD